MDVAKQFNNDADKVVKALVDHVIDTGLLSGHATLPSPPRAGISCQDYIIKKLPGGKIVNVQGGGACLSRSISVICFGSEDSWEIVARAINKKSIELFESMKEFLVFPLKRKVSGREKEVVFKDKEEYLQFLTTNEALLMWREGPDLAVVAHLLRSRVDVLILKDGKLDGGCPMVYGEQFEDRGKIVLQLSTEEQHYRAVVDTQNPHKNLQLLECQ